MILYYLYLHLWCIIIAHFYAPAMKWPGAYSVTLRHSVTPSFRNWFPFIIFGTVAHILFKFGIWIHHMIMQVKFEFGHGLMIFYRVIPLEKIFSLRSLTFVWMTIRFKLHM
jgi:hypothetical protein